MYYRLDMTTDGQNTFVTEDSHQDVVITAGRLLPKDTEEPFEFVMEIDEEDEDYDIGDIDDPGEEEDYDEDEDEEEEDEDEIRFQKPNMFAYYSNVSLMNAEMVQVLEDCGVDNIQKYKAIITHPETDYKNSDYFVVNIIGRVACASIDESDAEPLGRSYFFKELVVDPDKIGDLLIFRLKEYSFVVIVNEKVATALMAAKLPGLIVEPLQESARA